MKPSRAYLIGVATSGALIAAALAAFLSATSLFSNTSLPGAGVSAPGSSDAVAIDVGPLDPPLEATIPLAPSAASIPLLASTALPVPASPIESAASTAGRSSRSEDRDSPSADPAGSAAKRTGGSPAAAHQSLSGPAPNGTPPGLARNPGGLPPGLAKKPGGLPPGLANKPGGLPPGLAKQDNVSPGHARKHG